MTQTFVVGPTPKSITVGSQSIAITGAASSSGVIEITAAAHGRQTGDILQLSGVTGTVEANGQWVITVVDANHFTLNNSTFSNAYVSGGTAAHVGWACAALDTNLTLWPTPPRNLAACIRVLSAPVGALARFVYCDASDAAFATEMPAWSFGFPGGVSPSNDITLSDLVEHFPDALLAQGVDSYLRVKILFANNPTPGSNFEYVAFLEY